MLLEIVGQSVSDSSSTRIRIARDTFFQAPHYSNILSRCIPVTPAEPAHKSFELEFSQIRVLKKTCFDFQDFSWRCSAPLFILIRASLTLNSLFFSGPSRTCLSCQEQSQSSDEEMLSCRHDAGPAVYDAFLGFDAAFTTPPFKTTIPALARSDASMASVIHFFRERD